MFNDDIRDLLRRSAHLFSKRSALHSLWQEIAENFYPERADFTYRRSIGTDYAAHLMDSYPLLVRRDLGNAITTMLRPTDKDWGEMTTDYPDTLDHTSKAWLEWAWKRQRHVMYTRDAMFTRATKEGDHDFATFGQCVIQVNINRDNTGLLYRNHHLRDVAWSENEEGKRDHTFVRSKQSARDLVYKFGEDKVHPRVRELLLPGRDAYSEIAVEHMIVPRDRYPELTQSKTTHPYVSLWVDTDNQHAMEVLPSRRQQYVIPRWQTVSGSQYAFSPATITALPDARLIQAIALVLLEAGEKFVDPPIIATQDVVRGDVSLFSGGITWVDADYDERQGAALRPLQTDKSGMPIGFEMNDRQKMQIKEAFYLNKITMPAVDKEATAFEIGQMVQEYIRQATPLFEPMEKDYNGQLCEESFNALFWMGAFGSPLDVPRQLRDQEVEFKFRSPLHDAEGREEGQKFIEAAQLLEPAMAMDPTARVHFDVSRAFRAALEAYNIPEDWLVDKDEAAKAAAELREKAAAAEQMQAVAAMAQTAEAAGRAGTELKNATTET